MTTTKKATASKKNNKATVRTSKAQKTQKAGESRENAVSRADLHTEVTAQILAALEKGVLPWNRCYGIKEDGTREFPANYKTGAEYTGINYLLLSLTEFERPYFMTFKQAEALGGRVKKGATGIRLVYASDHSVKKEEDGTLTYIAYSYSFLKKFYVFNICDIEGIDFELPALKKIVDSAPEELLNNADTLMNGWSDCPEIVTGLKPYYLTDEDKIVMPAVDTFLTRANYIKTRFHEAAHATGAAKRLNRKGIVDKPKFGTALYGFEELIAEQAAAILCQHCGINTDENGIFDNSVQYLNAWIQTIRADKYAIIKSASAATKAVNLILGRSAPYQDNPAQEPSALPQQVEATAITA